MMSTTHFMNNKQRFQKAFLYGLLTAIVSGIVVAYLNEMTATLAHISFPILYPISAYAIAQAIHKAGGGISKNYAYLGMGLTIFSILISEMCTYMGYDVLIRPWDWITALRLIGYVNLQFQGTSIISIFFMILAVYVGYHESDITQR